MTKTVVLRSGVLGLALLTLAACGSTPTDRGLSGAGLGAAGGAIGGALVGVPATGAAIGAIVGGAIGAITQPSQIDLGKPAWKK